MAFGALDALIRQRLEMFVGQEPRSISHGAPPEDGGR